MESLRVLSKILWPGLLLVWGCESAETYRPKETALVQWIQNIDGSSATRVVSAVRPDGTATMALLLQESADFGGGAPTIDEGTTLLLLVQYNSAGQFVWQQQIFGPFDESTDLWLGATSEGKLILAIDQLTEPLPWSEDTFPGPVLVALAGNDGAVLDVQSLAAAEAERHVSDVAVAADGGVYVALTSFALVSEDDEPLAEPGPAQAGVLHLNPQWEAVYHSVVDSVSVSQSGLVARGPNNQVAFAFAAPVGEGGNVAVHVRKLDAEGGLAWGASIGEVSSAHSKVPVAMSSSGAVHVAGRFIAAESEDDGLVKVQRLDGDSGDVLWTVRFGGAQNAATVGGLRAVGDGVVLAGDAAGEMALGDLRLPDDETRVFYIAHLDGKAGAFQWLRYSGGSGDVALQGLSVAGSRATVSGVFNKIDTDTEAPRNEVFLVQLRLPAGL